MPCALGDGTAFNVRVRNVGEGCQETRVVRAGEASGTALACLVAKGCSVRPLDSPKRHTESKRPQERREEAPGSCAGGLAAIRLASHLGLVRRAGVRAPASKFRRFPTASPATRTSSRVQPRTLAHEHRASCAAATLIGTMTLIVDIASAARRLAAAEFQRWAETRTIFLSSEMQDLGALRARVAGALRDAGFSVVVFEDLGGRDEDAERAYLDGVARCDVDVGVLAHRYGTMLPSGRSPTHEEYLAATRLGKRVSFWLAADASGRQGNAVDFAQEVQAFHTTGQFADTEDLIGRLLQRLSEIAAEE